MLATFGSLLALATTPPAQCAAPMDAYCASPAMSACVAAVAKQGGALPLVALRDTDSRGGPDQWRCYSPSALAANATRYDPTSAHRTLYCSEDAALAAALTQCERPTRLVLLEAAARDDGAVCLDGSPPALWVRRGDPNIWHVHLEGGGWCYHDPPSLLEDNGCHYRAYGPAIESHTPPAYLGSSAMLMPNGTYGTAPPRPFAYFTSADARENPSPTLANASFAFVHYCDGASFTGDAAAPATIQGKPLYYRGRRVRDAVFAHLRDAEGMGSAESVVVSGTSAGGLAVYLNIDAIRAMLPTVPRVRGLASAGFFLAGHDAAATAARPRNASFTAQIMALAAASNSSAALDAGCVAAAAARGEAPEVCFFPQRSAPFIDTPVFALQSRFDTWQLEHIPKIATSNASGVEAYGREIAAEIAPLADAAAGGASARVPHALWLSSCLTHGLAQTPHWVKAITNGTHEWSAFDAWFSGALDGAHSRSWIDCNSYKCDASCP